MRKRINIFMHGAIYTLLVSCSFIYSSCKNESPIVIDDAAGIAELIALDKGSIPVEHFFKNPERTAFTISPDGNYIAYLGPYKNRLNIFIRKVNEETPIRLTSETDRDISSYFWKNNKTLLFVKDNQGDENFQLFSVTNNGETRQITNLKGVRINIIDQLNNDETAVIISMNKDNPALFEPYKVNTETGELTKLAENKDMKNPITKWLCDNEGKIRVALSIEKGTTTHLLYRQQPEEQFRSILMSDWKDMVEPLFFDADNKHIYALSNINRDKAALVRINPDDPENPEVVFEHPDVDVWWADHSTKRNVLTSVYYVTDKKHTIFKDENLGRHYEYLKSQLPGKELYFNSMDDREEKIIVRTFSDTTPGRFYLFNTLSKELTMLAVLNASIQTELMSVMKPVSFIARDGFNINGYLTIPKNSNGRDLPVVMLVHGGPMTRDVWGYKPEVQLLASRGYAVLQVNYRGSWGFGKSFAQAGFKQWGQKMQDDITDGAIWLIDGGIADKERIAIYGASYGGYAALAGLTFTPDLYACGIDFVGPSNLFTLLENLPAYWEPEKEMMYEMIGHPIHDSALLASVSPVFHADKISAPLFIAQGANDPRVTEIEAQQMVEALRSRNIQVVYMLKENEGHGFRLEENRLEFYKAMCGFLALHMPADPLLP